MKKLILLVTLAGMLAAPNLFATMQVTLMDNTSQYSHDQGGEFRAVVNAELSSAVNWSAYSASTKGTVSALTDGGAKGYNSSMVGASYFQTFCIEHGESFSPGTTYNVTLGNNAMYGHTGAPNGTPVTLGTAWLYSQFAAGTLETITGTDYRYTYGSGRSTDAGALQQAIWYFQGETGGVNNVWAQAANSAVSNMGKNAWNAANGEFGVKALNLGDPGRVQDQLVMTAVPEPATIIAGALLLLPFGASALRIIRRNKIA